MASQQHYRPALGQRGECLKKCQIYKLNVSSISEILIRIYLLWRSEYSCQKLFFTFFFLLVLWWDFFSALNEIRWIWSLSYLNIHSTILEKKSINAKFTWTNEEVSFWYISKPRNTYDICDEIHLHPCTGNHWNTKHTYMPREEIPPPTKIIKKESVIGKQPYEWIRKRGEKNSGKDVLKYRQRNNHHFLFFIYMTAEILEIQNKQEY